MPETADGTGPTGRASLPGRRAGGGRRRSAGAPSPEIDDQSVPLSRGGPIGLTRSGGAPFFSSTYPQRPTDRAHRQTWADVPSLTPHASAIAGSITVARTSSARDGLGIGQAPLPLGLPLLSVAWRGSRSSTAIGASFRPPIVIGTRSPDAKVL
jgi:hypothetical protein